MSFARGDRVRVASRPHDGHHRTPAYLQGRVGAVERVHDAFTNPETRAYGSDGLPPVRLYQVGFAQREVWDGYGGPSSDRIYVDVFEHWLEQVE